MFLCDKCHNPDKHFGHDSYGACEVCSRVTNCIDCHYQSCDAKKEKKNERRNR